MDASLLTDTLSLLVPYLQAGKKILVEHLDQGLKTVIPVITKNVYDLFKNFFSKEKTSTKMLEKAEENPDEENISGIKNLLKIAMEDESFKQEIQAMLKRLHEETKLPEEDVSKRLDAYSKKVKQYTMSNVSAHKSTIIQGDGNKVIK